MKVIAISGKAGSGKTTLAKNLLNVLKHSKSLKFAAPLYQVGNDVQTLLNQDIRKDRDLLIGIGDLFKNLYGETILTDTAFYTLKTDFMTRGQEYIIIDDMRYEHELNMLYSNFDCFTIRLDGDVSELDKRVGVKANRAHSSEKDLDNAAFDLYIDTITNNELEVLNEVLNNFS